ncbi:M20/M25/M40 family metallo-hydrolase [Evansella sp. AB-P1]|uniref:M20/M25/M40 family metallo-hydrolase n=1 Tax=Evansella sp. AB-P1 TaxID=3037653 RepID=UPI00241D19DE|nr:M20/M25/M40 family metallo-hydrolase [Evansella sp. AB-P1]MDG5787716.1 M20/M25/M40 family metallo-hydrolase [Evansella sp. AB-P1]
MDKWQTKDGLKDLTTALVEFGSVTGSSEEIEIMEFVEKELQSLLYFQKNKDFLQTYFTDDGRKFVSALVKSKTVTKKTVILIGHLDIVDIDDYGQLKHLAFRPKELTKQMIKQKKELPISVQNDLDFNIDDWLFGRGVMDMKAGVAVSMSIIEAATKEEFDGNILFLAVPDEEVDSVGMRSAVPILVELANKYNLQYNVIWNTEPMFGKYPGDEQLYIYQGSLGKIMPGFYCFGKETHVAQPFSGLNGNFMASYITKELELNPTFSEKIGEEKTPPPSTLLQKDLKEGYSVQIPHEAVAIYNIMTMKKSVEDITEELVDLAKNAAKNVAKAYREREISFSDHHEPKELAISVMTFQELMEVAVKKLGETEVENLLSSAINTHSSGDDRELSFQAIREIAAVCKELGPMIILFYAPPFYPPVSSVDNKVVDHLTKSLIKVANDEFDIHLQSLQYFPGLSDLSYTSLHEETSSFISLISNMPVWQQTYELPFEAMKQLNAPVINFGPLGKDAHSWTERLNLSFSFERLPYMIKEGINHVFSD